MTMTANHVSEHATILGATHVLNGNRLVMRIAQRLGAVSLALVGVLVWLAPGAGWESEVMLFKLTASLISALLSVALWQYSLPPLPPMVEVDVAAAELRLIRDGAPAASRVLERCAFSDLHLVELAGRRITFWGQGNRLLAEVTLSNAAAHASLLGALRAAGKLA
ncbi:hypothetical protein OS189_02130 [Sulfitobacter sp. F26169L]|uniref:hypothetical protein n=1 Tax=Sulfitobacter sp. F26169L TaxID=2996015 RepID=UPI002260ECB5|nr:hypothetical protein [Sulfitobacter sp. F26169L]MCX7565140.1 hypothetical protein [Sulfitobacter sp. F26169L]